MLAFHISDRRRLQATTVLRIPDRELLTVAVAEEDLWSARMLALEAVQPFSASL